MDLRVLALVCSDDEEEDTMQVDWEWGTVRYKMSNYNAAAAAAAAVRPAPGVQISGCQSTAAVVQRTSPQHSVTTADGARTDRDHVNNGVNRHSKLISPPVSIAHFARSFVHFHSVYYLNRTTWVLDPLYGKWRYTKHRYNIQEKKRTKNKMERRNTYMMDKTKWTANTITG